MGRLGRFDGFYVKPRVCSAPAQTTRRERLAAAIDAGRARTAGGRQGLQPETRASSGGAPAPSLGRRLRTREAMERVLRGRADAISAAASSRNLPTNICAEKHGGAQRELLQPVLAAPGEWGPVHRRNPWSGPTRTSSRRATYQGRFDEPCQHAGTATGEVSRGAAAHGRGLPGARPPPSSSRRRRRGRLRRRRSPTPPTPCSSRSADARRCRSTRAA